MKTFDASRFYFQDPEKGILRTPEPLAQEVIQKIPEYIFESSTTTFLDPACGRGTFLEVIAKKLKGYGHSWENITSRIFGIDIDPFSGIKQAQYFFGPKNIIVQDFLEMNLPTDWPKEFSIGLTNPPYGGGTNWKLHLDFLDKLYSLCSDQIVLVHPSNQFICPEEVNNKTLQKINEKIEEKLEEIVLFNGNPVFVIGKHFPISITYINKLKIGKGILVRNEITGKTSSVDSISKINLFNEYTHIPSIKSKVKSKMEFSLEERLKNKRGKGERGQILGNYIINIDSLVGATNDTSRNTMWKESFFTFIGKNQGVKTRQEISEPHTYWFEFSTRLEADNFLKYIKTDFARFCLSLMKTDKHVNSKMWIVPFMDFSQEWTEDKLYSYFGITKEEQEFIKEIIPPYYD